MTTSTPLDRTPGNGRTTRHLQRAIDKARKGEKIIFIAANGNESARLEALARQLAGTAAWVLDGGNLRIFSARSTPVVVEARGYRFLGAKDHTVMADHYAYECDYGAVVKGWAESME